jgi:antitoxin HicB
MSIERKYEIVLQPEPEGGFSVFGPELPSVATQGETIEEATEVAKEASRPTSK